ncbi:MAG: 4Fe-4S dicluster domain-containing protein [Candidatus Riflebacteria bacterium]|nr:4Fe-4S dicluster domain-containing protein [Candidatus Riflebacteria bacterium]
MIDGNRNSDKICLNCLACVEVCPEKLLPNYLYAMARKKAIDQLVDSCLMECSECGNCSRICTSELPLKEVFQEMKALIADLS